MAQTNSSRSSASSSSSRRRDRGTKTTHKISDRGTKTTHKISAHQTHHRTPQYATTYQTNENAHPSQQTTQYRTEYGHPHQAHYQTTTYPTTTTTYESGTMGIHDETKKMNYASSAIRGVSGGSSTTNIKYELAREVSSNTLTGRETVLGERIVEHEVRVPKRVVREDIVEKVIVVPEKIVHEEIVEQSQMVRERIVEVARPIYQEKIIEVPEIEYVEKIIEVPETIIQEKIREVPRVEIQERIVEVPKIITQEKVVEIPEIEYREVPVEKIVDVSEIHEQFVVKEVRVPQYVDKPVAEHVTVEVAQKVERNIPIPVEAVTTFEYRLPHIRPHYKKVTFPIYVPRFVEVPVPDELVTGALGQQAQGLAQHVSLLTSQTAPSLCEIENIASDIKRMDLATHIASADYHQAIQTMWAEGRLNIAPIEQFNAASRGVSTVTGSRHIPIVYQQTPTKHSHSHSHQKSSHSRRKASKQSSKA